LQSSSGVSEAQIEEPQRSHTSPASPRFIDDRVLYIIYALALAVSISTWFIAVRAPLWQDETGTYYQISAGFSGIPSHVGGLSFPAYAYILWFATKIIGSSEIALRVPSILAMLGAVYLLYLAARELFDRDIALIAAVIFCLHPIVAFASIDVRPYAFAVLATNAAILVLFRLRRSDSIWLAALFGFTAAWIVWFHYLFAVILPALVLCFLVVRIGNRKTLWRQFGVAFAVFALAFLPMIPGLQYMFRTSGTHVFEQAPHLSDLAGTLAPGWLLWLYFGAVFAAFLAFAARQKRSPLNRVEGWHLIVCASLALIPILILYGVSVGTSIHTFVSRHRLVAVPGIALCWAFALSRFHSRTVRLLFCVTFVAATAYAYFSSPIGRQHNYTWKYALEVAEKNASADGAPLVICSDFPEADYATMPLDSAKDSPLLAQLSYYKVSVPVVALPRAFNGETMRVGSRFLQEAAQKHQRFLALGYKYSYETLDWLAQNAAATHSVRKLGTFDDVEVLEFVPRTGLAH